MSNTVFNPTPFNLKILLSERNMCGTAFQPNSDRLSGNLGNPALISGNKLLGFHKSEPYLTLSIYRVYHLNLICFD